jgi:hypothetical protein
MAGAKAFSIGTAMVMSATLPGVGASATIQPQGSARQWIFVVLPLRETGQNSISAAVDRTTELHPKAAVCLRSARCHLETLRADRILHAHPRLLRALFGEVDPAHRRKMRHDKEES